MTRTALDDPRYYFNRHLQWLEFNRRVLEEARDIGNPLLERVKFLAITANNLDEFVEVRVSSFLQRIEHGSREVGPDGLIDRDDDTCLGYRLEARLLDRDVVCSGLDESNRVVSRAVSNGCRLNLGVLFHGRYFTAAYDPAACVTYGANK